MSAKQLFISTGVVLLAVLAALYWWQRPSVSRSAALAARQLAMETLGARLAQLRPQCKVLALSNPFAKDAGYANEKSQFERAGLAGLRQGLGKRSPVSVGFPQIRPEFFSQPGAVSIPADSRTPLSYLMEPQSVEQLAQAHGECQVIVSLIGLPLGVDQLKLWDAKDPRCFALLLPDLRVLGPPAKALEAFQNGKLLAAVVEEKAAGKPLIVTRDNIAQVLEQQPQLLGY